MTFNLRENSEAASTVGNAIPMLVSVREGTIVAIGSRDSEEFGTETFELNAAHIYPGFIDVHCHGGVGVDVNGADTNGLLKVALFLANQGVTSWLPTMVPDSHENYVRTIAAIDELMSVQGNRAVAQCLGVHYEGVFASEKMCGALRPEYFKSFTGSEIDEMPRLKNGIHMTTLAPEVDGGIELITELSAHGWIVSIGHTSADTKTLDLAFAAGARHMTHFFNAMSGIHHREVGVAGWGLANPQVTFDIIADGIHVHPKMVGVACRAKSPANVSLISDSVTPTGLGDGEYELWGETITVNGGRTRNERGSIAGSVATMLDGSRVLRSLGFHDSDIAEMTSASPARLLGAFGERGSLEPGKRADLVGLNASGNVVFTMIAGQMVHVL